MSNARPGSKGEERVSHGKDDLRLASPMHPAASFWRVPELEHIDHV